jgi:hypothetical protein
MCSTTNANGLAKAGCVIKSDPPICDSILHGSPNCTVVVVPQRATPVEEVPLEPPAQRERRDMGAICGFVARLLCAAIVNQFGILQPLEPGV